MQFSYRVIIKQRRDIECRLEGWGHSGLGQIHLLLSQIAVIIYAEIWNKQGDFKT